MRRKYKLGKNPLDVTFDEAESVMSRDCPHREIQIVSSSSASSVAATSNERAIAKRGRQWCKWETPLILNHDYSNNEEKKKKNRKRNPWKVCRIIRIFLFVTLGWDKKNYKSQKKKKTNNIIVKRKHRLLTQNKFLVNQWWNNVGVRQGCLFNEFYPRNALCRFTVTVSPSNHLHLIIFQ